jgi:hypothetical protein
VLRALGQTLEVVPYSAWDVLLPEGDLSVAVGNDGFEAVVGQLRGSAAVEEWRRFMEVLRPIAAAADALPLLSMRRVWTGWPNCCSVGGGYCPISGRCDTSPVPLGR